VNVFSYVPSLKDVYFYHVLLFWIEDNMKHEKAFVFFSLLKSNKSKEKMAHADKAARVRF